MAVSLLAMAAGPLLSGCVGREGAEGVRDEQGASQDDDEISGDHFWRRANGVHNRE